MLVGGMSSDGFAAVGYGTSKCATETRMEDATARYDNDVC